VCLKENENKQQYPNGKSQAQQSRPGNLLYRHYFVWAALIIIVLFVSIVRIRLLAVPLERDEGEYAYAGQLILQGIAPYRLLCNMKMPGIYAAYALILAVFGLEKAISACTWVFLLSIWQRFFWYVFLPENFSISVQQLWPQLVSQCCL